MLEAALASTMQEWAYRWSIWPAVVLLVWAWTAGYGFYARRKKLSTNWARYFADGQAQIFHAFLVLGTGVPGLISLLGPAPTSVSVGGDVLRYEITGKQFVSPPIDVKAFSRVQALARVTPPSGSGGATVVVYGVNDSGAEGELFRFTPTTTAWVRCERLITTRYLRVVADFGAGTDPAATATAAPAAGAEPAASKPQLDLILYFAPKAAPPSPPPATPASTS